LPVLPPSAPPSGACGPLLDELQAAKTNASITMQGAARFRRTFMPAMLAHDAAKDNSRTEESARSAMDMERTPESRRIGMKSGSFDGRRLGARPVRLPTERKP
jgi:hypothetical protein